MLSFEIPISWERVKGIDYGYASESCCLWGTIDMNDGKLQYKKTVVKSPISKKYLLTCLQNYYKDDNHMIEELSNHILDNRQTKTYESIKHKN